MKQLDLIKIARKAFRQGSDNFGEKIVGYTKEGFHPCSITALMKRRTDRDYPTRYLIVLKLLSKNGKKCNTSVGFEIEEVRLARKKLQRWGQDPNAEDYCEDSPFNLYLKVISGHVVFRIPITHEMLHLFPKGLNRMPLESYSYQELEERVLEVKKQSMAKRIREVQSELMRYKEELGIRGGINVKFTEYAPLTEDDLSF